MAQSRVQLAKGWTARFLKAGGEMRIYVFQNPSRPTLGLIPVVRRPVFHPRPSSAKVRTGQSDTPAYSVYYMMARYREYLNSMYMYTYTFIHIVVSPQWVHIHKLNDLIGCNIRCNTVCNKLIMINPLILNEVANYTIPCVMQVIYTASDRREWYYQGVLGWCELAQQDTEITTRERVV